MPFATGFPGCCGLNVVEDVYEMFCDPNDDWVTQEDIDHMKRSFPNEARYGTSMPISGTKPLSAVCTICQEGSIAEFHKAQEFLKSIGWKLLGKFPTVMKSKNRYLIELWGSPEFVLPREVKRANSRIRRSVGTRGTNQTRVKRSVKRVAKAA